MYFDTIRSFGVVIVRFCPLLFKDKDMYKDKYIQSEIIVWENLISVQFNLFFGPLCSWITGSVSAWTCALGGMLLCWTTGECPGALWPCLCSHLWSFVLSHFPQTPPGTDGSPHPKTLSNCFGFSFPECFPLDRVHTSPQPHNRTE